jgi:DnaJ domain
VSQPDYYTILQVAETAEPEIIKAAYEKLVFKYHPDRNFDPHAPERFRQVAEAHEVLGDPKRRSGYDTKRRAEIAETARRANANVGYAPIRPSAPAPIYDRARNHRDDSADAESYRRASHGPRSPKAAGPDHMPPQGSRGPTPTVTGASPRDDLKQQKQFAVGCTVILAAPIGILILFLYPRAVLTAIIFLGAAATAGLLVRSLVAGFAETGGNFDLKSTIRVLAKLLTLVALTITLVIWVISGLR